MYFCYKYNLGSLFRWVEVELSINTIITDGSYTSPHSLIGYFGVERRVRAQRVNLTINKNMAAYSFVLCSHYNSWILKW